MKAGLNTFTKQPSFKGLYNNKLLLKGLECAADNGALFSATASLVLSCAARPLAIMATPKTDNENKKIACAKSVASSAVGYMVMFFASLPIAKAVKKINENPIQFLKKATIKNLKENAPSLLESKSYQLATQLFKLGIGFVIAAPKSALTCVLIPPIMSFLFPPKKPDSPIQQRRNSKVISFKGLYNSASEKLAKGIGQIINTKPIQDFARKFSETNFALHIMNTTDVLLTWAFVQQTKRSKKIEESRKKALIYNTEISTALSIAGGYTINHFTKKPTEKFIQKFSAIHKDSPKLEKYIEGIKIAKPVLILGSIYYIIIPVISTFFADRADVKNQTK